MADRLHDYQLVARDYLRGLDRAGLFLDMGLGKTAASLSALEDRHLPVLVVAPKRVAETVWPLETPKWRPDLSCAVAKGTPANRLAALMSNADIVSLGQDNLGDLAKLRRSRPFRTVIIDELSGYKNRGSARWKAMRRVVTKPEVAHVFGLTGTPAPNGYMNLWAQIYLLDGGQRLGTTLTTYRSRYFYAGRQLPNGVVTEWVLREGAKEKIDALLEDLCLSMKSEGRIELPPVTENHVVVDLPPQVKKVYKDLKRDMVVDLDLLGGDIHSAVNAAVLSSKLSQVSAGFLYADPDMVDTGRIDSDGLPVFVNVNEGKYTELHNEKVKAVQEIVEGTGGSPVLVFYRYKAELEMLRRAFPGAKTVDEPGVIFDWNAGQVPVLLAHPKSASHGLNLQHGGHTAVWTSLDWDSELWEQANKRLARQGQKHPVVIHCIMTKRSVDYLIRASLTEKVDLQNSLLSHLESPL